MYDTSTLPSPRPNHLPFKKEEKHQLGVSERYLRAKVMKIIGKSYHFRLFFSRNIKILLCEGTQQP